MPNLRIISDNAADRATITVANTAAGMGASNLLTDIKGEACRILANTGTVKLTWPSIESVSAVVIPACNLSADSTARVRVYDATVGGTLLADTGVVDAAPGAILANWDFTQPLNVNAFSEVSTLVALYFDLSAARRVEVDLSDPNATFLDLSRIVVGSYFEPSYQADWGVTVGTNDLSTNSRAASGDLKTTWGPRNGMLAFDLGWISEEDRARVRQIIAGGVGRSLFISLFPEDDDPVLEQDNSIYGKPAQSGSMAYSTYSLHSTKFNIQEW